MFSTASSDSLMEQEKLQNEPKNQEKSEELDFNNPSYSFVPGNHEWRQRGFFLICYGCELQHAVYIGSEKILTGFTESGEPILSKKMIIK